MKKLSIFLVLFLAVFSVAAQEKYSGKIGEFNVIAFIDMRAAEDAQQGDSVGYYFYNDRPKTKFTLKLKSYEEVITENFESFRTSYHIILNEYTPKGFNSGTFDGWTGALSSGYNGTFTNSQGKEYNFMLEEQ
ncbi:MAG: hypothetical protein II956_13570 [Bacteroidales bacterium]|nr:hypothetical protein [Bacteroidales bacterium]